MDSWEKMHKRLWPAVDVPPLLSPMALTSKQKLATQGNDTESFFAEGTLPTSWMISAICALIVTRKSPCSGLQRQGC